MTQTKRQTSDAQRECCRKYQKRRYDAMTPEQRTEMNKKKIAGIIQNVYGGDVTLYRQDLKLKRIAREERKLKELS